MRKCILWGTGEDFIKFINVIKFYETRGDLEIVGLTSQKCYYDAILGYPYIPLEDIHSVDFEYIIIMSILKEREILDEALSMGYKNENIIYCRVMMLPEFDFEKYVALKKCTPSIIAVNCCGAFLYHRLGLEFKTPFINLFVEKDKFIKMLDNLEYYMSQELKFVEERKDKMTHNPYPVGALDDIYLNFNHSKTFEDAKRDFERRKSRIDWNNMIYLYYSEEEQDALRFASLAHEKKICFVPFESTHESLLQINIHSDDPFWKIVNACANGHYIYYDSIELLNGNKKLMVEVKK